MDFEMGSENCFIKMEAHIKAIGKMEKSMGSENSTTSQETWLLRANGKGDNFTDREKSSMKLRMR